MGSVFKVGFDIHNYKDIVPDVHEYRKVDEVINMDIVDIEDHVWRSSFFIWRLSCCSARYDL